MKLVLILYYILAITHVMWLSPCQLMIPFFNFILFPWFLKLCGWFQIFLALHLNACFYWSIPSNTPGAVPHKSWWIMLSSDVCVFSFTKYIKEVCVCYLRIIVLPLLWGLLTFCCLFFFFLVLLAACPSYYRGSRRVCKYCVELFRPLI